MADPFTALLAIWLLSIGSLAAAAWLADAITARQLRDRHWREFNARRRQGRNNL
jgi:type II secretory pathway component PulJ